MFIEARQERAQRSLMLLRFKGFDEEWCRIFKLEHNESKNTKLSCVVIIGRLRQVEEEQPGFTAFWNNEI